MPPFYTYPAAELSKAMRIITIGFALFTVGMAAFAVLLHPLFGYVAGLLSLILLGCWLKQPMAYDWAGDDLIVHFRWGSKQRGPIDGLAPVDHSIVGSIRAWGNGGLFAMTGIYWHKKLGNYHAYLTSHYPEHLLMVDRHGKRTLISPSDREAFIKARTVAPGTEPSTREPSTPAE